MEDKPFEIIDTQEKLDAIVRDRVRRAREKAVEPYADYEELKAKAKAADAQAKELEDLRRRADEAEGAVSRLTHERELEQVRAKISEETGVPARLISGTDEDSMRESATALAAWAKPSSGVSPSSPGSFASDAKPKKATRDLFAESMAEALK